MTCTYDGGSNALLHLSGIFSGAFPSYRLQASPAPLAYRDTAPAFPVNSGPAARLAGFRLPVSEALFGTGLQSSFSCLLKNTEALYLPGGDTNLYKNGEYVGRLRFEGISSGRTRTVPMGR